MDPQAGAERSPSGIWRASLLIFCHGEWPCGTHGRGHHYGICGNTSLVWNSRYGGSRFWKFILCWFGLYNAEAWILISVFVSLKICNKLRWWNLLISLFGGSFFAWNNLYLCVYLLNRTVIIWLNSLHPLPVPLSFNQTFTDNFYFLSLFCFLILEWFGFFCFPTLFCLLAPLLGFGRGHGG